MKIDLSKMTGIHKVPPEEEVYGKRDTSGSLTPCQQKAYKAIMTGRQNIFVTGGAGTGKSYLMNAAKECFDLTEIPYVALASTGAAAVIINGRTFHSFFCLGLAKGPRSEIINKALDSWRTVERIQSTSLIILDEISMIPGRLLSIANDLCQKIRGDNSFMGGIRVIAVGDFHQLPPIGKRDEETDWAFLNQSWHEAEFEMFVLKEVMRTTDSDFLEVLEDIRMGRITSAVNVFMNSHQKFHTADITATRLYSTKAKVNTYNATQLKKLRTKEHKFKTEFSTPEAKIVKKLSNAVTWDNPLRLKTDALVMIRKNDPNLRYVNGTLGRVKEIMPGKLIIKTLNDMTIDLKKARYELHDGDGEVIAHAKNFPVCLAWAQTIHKAQGASIDSVVVDIGYLWEAGHAYVALSRATNPHKLYVERWNPQRIFTDKEVVKFYSRNEEGGCNGQ